MGLWAQVRSAWKAGHVLVHSKHLPFLLNPSGQMETTSSTFQSPPSPSLTLSFAVTQSTSLNQNLKLLLHLHQPHLLTLPSLPSSPKTHSPPTPTPHPTTMPTVSPSLLDHLPTILMVSFDLVPATTMTPSSILRLVEPRRGAGGEE